jgi:hypothetical protein
MAPASRVRDGQQKTAWGTLAFINSEFARPVRASFNDDRELFQADDSRRYQAIPGIRKRDP